MIIYLPHDCHKEFETVHCRSITLTKRYLFGTHRKISYNNVKYIKIRRYNILKPTINLIVMFKDGTMMNEFEVVECHVCRKNLVPIKERSCFFCPC